MRASRGRLLALAVTLLIQATPKTSFAQQALDIQMQLTNSTILLGEPDWVDMAITNRSNQSLRVDTSPACFMSGTKPLTVEIPRAEAGNGEPLRCDQNGAGGDCYSTWADLKPGEAITHRYVLSGDFRIVHSGSYSVRLEKVIHYGATPPTAPVGTPGEYLPLKKEQTSRVQVTLKVLPANPAGLLEIEQALAQQAMEPISEPQVPALANGQPYDMDGLRRFLANKRKVADDEMRARASIAEGLAAYPAAGMEAVFGDWVASDKGYGYGLPALYKLNTLESRQLIAEAADVVGAPSAEAATQNRFANFRASAVYDLARMGDRSYIPLVEKLTSDSNSAVRTAAIQGLALLGGEAELPMLSMLAHNATTMRDRQDAIGAMGETASLKAVPLLVDLITSYSDESYAARSALLTLTHHEIAAADQTTAPKAQTAWQDWWVHNQHTARAFAPGEDCSSTQ